MAQPTTVDSATATPLAAIRRNGTPTGVEMAMTPVSSAPSATTVATRSSPVAAPTASGVTSPTALTAARRGARPESSVRRAPVTQGGSVTPPACRPSAPGARAGGPAGPLRPTGALAPAQR